ncbi:hypothetical protein GCM10010345_84930 [Streptomyces canarius]|uniref:Ricin B lectin domain-containing protein n=1 Tax=Streptomyces canarius TaxID=285453 RepID=A0ABQ3D999_9ACTN|nr:hypothetical protein GCM10010345_84930 [Streptomyces canarius]
MGVADNGTASGTAVTLQVCDGSDRGNGHKGTTGADGSLVHTWMCDGSARQEWSLPASA